jgi:hypothetical protein
MDVSSRSHRFVFRVDWICILVIVISSAVPSSGQGQQRQLKPTEAVINRYQKLILRGDLLTPEGWRRASELFTSAEPYPSQGEILVEWTGTRTMGEEWNNGSRAQVNTKWNDYYGTIDSNLKFKSDLSVVLPTAEFFTLVRVPRRSNNSAQAASDSGDGQWKIEGSLKLRIADLPLAINYLESMRDRTTDPVLRRNAEQSIRALKHRRSGCGVPNPC